MVHFSDHCWGNPTLANMLPTELLLPSLQQTIVATFVLTVRDGGTGGNAIPAGDSSCCDCEPQGIKLAPVACTIKLAVLAQNSSFNYL